jgi:uncharacterized membrane protein YgcG
MKSLWNRIMRPRGGLHAGRYAAIAQLPEGLDTLWLERISRLHPGSGINEKALRHVAEALLTYFDCLARTDKPCALPSLAAQVLWDAWADLDSAGLDRLRAHHFPSSADSNPPRSRAQWEEAIANCLLQARAVAGMSPMTPALPALFLLDQQLALPGGHGWLLSGGRIGYVKLDGRGLMSAVPNFPEVLTPAGMLLAGLVSATAFNDFFAAAHAGSGFGGGDGGGGDGGGGGAGDGCGGDGGGDGGGD